MHRVLILGGGFGGISCALALRERLDAVDEVVLVERRPTFAMGLRKNWALLGIEPHAAGERPIARLADRGITVVAGTVTAIDPAARAADVDGTPYAADALVVALGAQRDADRIPGLRANAIDAYDPAAGEAGARAIEAFAGGRLVVGVFGAPHPCPPAPYELALLLAERLEARSLPYSLLVVTPLPRSLPILGEVGCAAFDSRLTRAGITLRTEVTATEVRSGEIVVRDGRIPFDLLLGVPPHRAPTVVSQAGLTGPSGWVPVDARGLETRFPGVHAIGDVAMVPMANGSALPKAGVFADAEGRVVASRIADRLVGREPTETFTGDGMCFLETGGGMAAMVRGGFLDDPPHVELTEASPAHLAAKRAFETDRLTAWFGG
jgi:sulfide:quinone oxidoreductase